MNKISAYIKIIRPNNFLITFLTVIVASLVSYKGEFPSVKVMIAALTASLTMSAGNIINDIFDLNGDRINHPERSLPSGMISLQYAYIYYFILSAVSLFLSIFISIINIEINLLALFLLYLYSYKLKRIPLIGNLVVSMLTGLVFIYGGIAVNNIYYSIIPAMFASLINLIREIIKDMEDTKGDMQQGIISFPSKFGFKYAKNAIVTLNILLILLIVIPYINGIYGIYYFAVILIFIIPSIVYLLISLMKNDSRENLNKLSFILKLDMVFGLIAVYVGK